MKGTYAWTTASYSTTGSDLTFSVSTTATCNGDECADAGFLSSTRPITLKLVNALPPERVEVGGKPLAFSRYPGARGLHPKGTWHYEGDAATLVVNAAGTPPFQGMHIYIKGAVATAGNATLVRSKPFTADHGVLMLLCPL